MIYRKEYIVDEEEYFEVEYLDASSIVDEEIRGIVNEKIETLKDSYNRKTRVLYKRIKILMNEIEILRNKLNKNKNLNEDEIN